MAPGVLDELSKAHGVCIASVAVIEGGTVGSIETRRCDPGPWPAGGVVFQGASLGKPVFAYAVHLLAQDGKLDLDAPLSEYLPDGYTHVQDPFSSLDPPVTDHVAPERLGAVTAAQLLTHTSGLPNWSRGPLSFEFEPGASWQYSGEGYVLLQRVVEEVSGMDFGAFMQSRVFEPLRMTDSSYVWEARFESRLAVGTDSDGEPVTAEHFRKALAAATLYTTSADYARFVAAVLADRELKRTLIEPRVPVQEDCGFAWGPGWGLWQGGDDRHIWHWGDNPGFKALVAASIRTGDGVVILTNSDEGLALARSVVDKLMPAADGIFGFYMLKSRAGRMPCRGPGCCD
jgi:CubicO group peptidase (beta-lactamase class C family)